MSELFWIFGGIALVTLMMVVFIRRISWAWNFMILIVIVFAGLFKMTGTARDAVFFATIERMHGDVEVLYQGVIPKKFIYLLIRQDPAQHPYLVEVAWTKELEQQMRAAQMKATEQQTPLMVNIDMLSRWRVPTPPPREKGTKGSPSEKGEARNGTRVPGSKEGGEQMFYPMPVTGDPDKNPARSITIDREITQGGHE